MITTPQFPYYDDFDPSKNFQRILFVPGNPVQARELTQIQSILQEQVKRHGDHIFKNGTVVLPGHVFYDGEVKSLKIETFYSGVNAESYADFLIGKTLVGQSTGVSALVVHFENSTDSESTTLFVKYVSGNATASEFQLNEELIELSTNLLVKIQATADAIGDGSIVTINEGVYYINGFFVGVNKQTKTVSKYSNTADAVIGLTFTEEIITPEADNSLYDNSQGFSNLGAPGADRYKISLILESKGYDYTVSPTGNLNFIELMKIKTGSIQYKNDDTEYAEINKMLARRTFDESGDYVVDEFSYSLKDVRSNNRGQWLASTAYLDGDIVSNAGVNYYSRTTGYSGSTPPTHLYGTALDGSILWTQVQVPNYNDGINSDNTLSLDEQNAMEATFIADVSPGKAYINGFEVNKKNKSKLTFNKARETNQVSDVSLFAPVGQYITVNTLAGLVSPFTQINLKDYAGSVVGTAYVKSIEYVSGTIGASSAIYNVFLFGVSMNAGKDFTANVVTLSYSSSFTASVVLSETALTGIVTATNSSGTVSGKGTLFQTELQAGSLIKIDGVYKKVLSIASNVSLTIDTWTGGTQTDVSAFECLSELKSSGANVKQLDNPFIKTIRDASGFIDTQYIVLRYITFNVSAGNTATATLTVPGESFSSTAAADHIVTNSSNVTQAVTYALNSNATALTISAGSLPNGTYRLMAKIVKQGNAAKEKTKTLSTKTIIVNSGNITDDLGSVITTAYNFTSQKISLTECDAVRVIKITMSGGAVGAPYSATGEVDVTTWFRLNTGQTPDYYDLSMLNRVGSTPTKPLKITFEYFAHTAGDYFSVDSYKNTPYEMIPSVTLGGTEYNLRDCLDFRSRKSDDGVSFTGAGASISEPMNSTTVISTSYSHYMGRMDIITLGQSGDFAVVQGIASINPVEPTVSESLLQMAIVSVIPYTADPAKCPIQSISHKRYTMSDIARIDSRVSNVEYYVALNELEKKTANMNIVDSNGLTRYKNGFFADTFGDYNGSDVTNSDFSTSVNDVDSNARPMIAVNDIKLAEPNGTTDAARLAANYRVTGNMASLPYSEVSFVSQLAGSRAEFINPFAVVTFNGTGVLNLFPSQDKWVDTKTDFSETWVPGIDIIRSRLTNQNFAAIWLSRNPGRAASTSNGLNFQNRVAASTWAVTQPPRAVVGTQETTVKSVSSNTTTALSKMRKKSVAVLAQGIKPFTSIYSFLDSKAINGILTPASTLRFTSISGTFLGMKQTSATTEHREERVTTQGSYDIFEFGDVVLFYSGSTKVGSAVVASVEYQYTTAAETVLKLVNIKGSISASNTITGTLSGAKGTVVSLTAETSISTNSLGNFCGVLNFNETFNNGDYSVKLLDVASGDIATAKSSVSAKYSASGSLNTITSTTVKRLDTLVDVNEVRFSGDPLAQTFTVPQDYKNGAFITSVDIFFAQKLDETLPVFVQICEVENGYPSANVLKNASAEVYPNQIQVSTDSTIATNVKFPGLVQLEAGKEYALKLLSNSIKYKVWIAQIGDKRVDIPLYISEQPSLGSLFKSQNNSTWEPDQMQDLKFDLKAASFSTGKSGTITMTNVSDNVTVGLSPNPFLITNGSPNVLVKHKNHGLYQGLFVNFSGSTYANLNGKFQVAVVVDDDTYVVVLSSNAVTTDLVGGSAVLASKSIRIDEMNIQVESIIPANSGVNVTTITSDANGKESAAILRDINTWIDLPSPKYVYNKTNEEVFFNNSRTFETKIDLWSTDSRLSPIVNITSVSASMMENRVDNRTDNTYAGSYTSYLDTVAPVVAESAATGNTLESRYISIPVVMDDMSSEMKIMFAANIPYPASIELWYRTNVHSTVNPIDGIVWTQVPLSLENQAALKSYTDFELDVNPTLAFNEYQVKIVFKSSNSAKVADIKDLRVIALA